MPLLLVNEIYKNFGGVRALDKISIAVETNMVHAIIGPNGAGKTTLFNIISGLLPPTSGEISFNNENITNLKPPKSTYAVASYSDLGHIYFTNGDQCDYMAGVMYETDLTKEEIVAFYSGVTVPSIDGKSNVDIDLSFHEKESSNGRLIFQIQTIEGSLKSGLDIRCS